ncbi:MAG TPA: ABC transporter permease [Gaiellaceae bacterium]
MIDLLRSELLKVRTTRGWWGYLAVIVLLAGLGTAADLGSTSEEQLAEPEYQRGLVEGIGVAALLGIVLGITIITSEFRHGTITPTLLTEPRRERVVGAKAVAALLLAVVFALVALAILSAVAVTWLSIVGEAIHATDGQVVRRAAQMLLFALLWALLGVAIGTLVQSQVVALVGTLIWLFLAETILIGVLGLLDLDGLADYLPFQALDSADGTTDDLLPYWAGVGVSLGWIAVIGAAGTERLRRRDIT